jgi:hypothetical protein
VHPRYLTPSFSTLLMGGVSILWTVVILLLSSNALEDSIVAIGFPICVQRLLLTQTGNRPAGDSRGTSGARAGAVLSS